jgi:hypothetical protein
MRQWSYQGIRRGFGCVALMLPMGLLGCTFDYYPNHDTPTTQPDEMKSGSQTYGGQNSETPIIIPGTGSATNPSASAPTTSSGLP